MESWIVAMLMTAGLSFVLNWMLQGQAARVGLVDSPTERKKHEGHVPLVGGIAIFCALLAGMALLEVPLTGYYSLIVGGLLLLATGIMDDLRDLPARMRFPAQIMAALSMALWGGVVLRDFGYISFNEMPLSMGAMAVPVTVFCAVGVINAMNMTDGLDGLAGGLGVVTLGALAYFARNAGLAADFGVLMTLIASVAGFLVLNARSPWLSKAKVFMGDAGSMFLGFALAWFLIRLSQGESRPMNPVTALWIFALPLMDTINVILRRTARGESPFKADRRHLHHVLLAAGCSAGQAVALIWALALILALAGIAGQEAGLSENTMLIDFLLIFSLYVLSMVCISRRTENFLARVEHVKSGGSAINSGGGAQPLAAENPLSGVAVPQPVDHGAEVIVAPQLASPETLSATEPAIRHAVNVFSTQHANKHE